MSDIQSEIIEIVAANSPRTKVDVQPGMSLRDDLGYEDIDLFGLAYAVETEFDLADFADEAVLKWEAVDDVVKAVNSVRVNGTEMVG